jgi:hypothetical protein
LLGAFFGTTKPEKYIGTPSLGATVATLMPAFCHCTARAFHMMPQAISPVLSAWAKASLEG